MVDVSMSPGTPETDELGSWEADWDVPEEWAPDVDIGPGDYGIYNVEAWQDTDVLSADLDFEIGASLELDIEEGPVGTVVEISGRGFTEDATIGEGDVELDGVECIVETDDEVNSRGEFTVEVVIPSVIDDPDDYGKFDFIVTESGGRPGCRNRVRDNRCGRDRD
jgi:hypothetical protein